MEIAVRFPAKWPFELRETGTLAGRSYRFKDKALAAPTELPSRQENAKPKKDN